MACWVGRSWQTTAASRPLPGWWQQLLGARAGCCPVAVAFVEGVAASAAQLEAEQRTREAYLLLSLLPDACHRLMLDFHVASWEACPVDRNKADFAMKHLGKFGPGSLALARRTLVRLRRWLVLNGMPGKAATFECEAGVLIWFVLDEQRASARGRKSGESRCRCR